MTDAQRQAAWQRLLDFARAQPIREVEVWGPLMERAQLGINQATFAQHPGPSNVITMRPKS